MPSAHSGRLRSAESAVWFPWYIRKRLPEPLHAEAVGPVPERGLRGKPLGGRRTQVGVPFRIALDLEFVCRGACAGRRAGSGVALDIGMALGARWHRVGENPGASSPFAPGPPHGQHVHGPVFGPGAPRAQRAHVIGVVGAAREPQVEPLRHRQEGFGEHAQNLALPGVAHAARAENIGNVVRRTFTVDEPEETVPFRPAHLDARGPCRLSPADGKTRSLQRRAKALGLGAGVGFVAQAGVQYGLPVGLGPAGRRVERIQQVVVARQNLRRRSCLRERKYCPLRSLSCRARRSSAS